jgi:hypothetical protein
MSDQWMGSVAAQDQYRPLGNDPWTNTMRGTAPAPGQGFEPVQQSPVLYNTKAGPITEADIENTIGIGMGVSGGGLKTDIVKAPGIKAFHSSPHDFDKFDLAKIGTGEGAQVYGHGLYFAENPAVSGQGGQYWQQFVNKFGSNEKRAAEILQQQGFDRGKALELVNKEIELAHAEPTTKMFNDFAKQSHIEQLLARQRLLESGQPVGPRTYEVNINADPAHMLDWDKALSAHPEAVRDVLARTAWKKEGATAADLAELGVTGEHAYKRLITGEGGTALPGLSRQPQAIAASAALQEAGIPGIKYLDQGSRSTTMQNATNRSIATYTDQLATASGAERQALLDKIEALRAYAPPPPSSNYVIFDPNIINIMKKYGIAGAAPAGMGALAAQDNYQPEERL